jgi:hypothetical protein
MFEAYSVGIRLSLVNHLSSGLLSIAGQFNHLNGLVAQTDQKMRTLEASWLRLQKGALIGGGLTALGVGLGAMLKGPYEEAKKLEMAKAKWRTLNLSESENGEAFGTAIAMSQKVLGTTITDNIGLVQDLHTAFGDLHHAVSYAPTMAKFVKVAQVQNGEHAGEGLAYAAIKALEERGAKVINDPSALNSELSRMSQVYLATNGRVNPQGYMQAALNGKMPFSLASPEFLYGPFAAYMQALGADRAGTTWRTTSSSLSGGHMDKQAHAFFAQLGMTHDGQRNLDKPFTDMLRDRPDEFVWNALMPAVRKRFGMDMTDQQVAELVSQKTNASTGQFLGWFIQYQAKAVKDTAIFNKSQSYALAYAAYSKTPEGAEQSYEAAMKNFKAVVGTAYLPMIVDGLNKLAPALTSLADWASRNQGAAKVITGMVGAMSALAAASGVILLTKAAFGGLALAVGGTNVGGMAISTLLAGAAKGFGVVGAALFAVYEVVRLYDAMGQIWSAKANANGAHLTAGAAARLKDPATSAALRAMDDDFKPAVDTVRTFASDRASRSGDVYLDGKKVGKLLASNFAAEMSRPTTSPVGGFDPSLNLAPFAVSGLR